MILRADEVDDGFGKKKKPEDGTSPLPTTDPLIERFEKIERKVVAWNDRFGMDPSRKDRITRKISNTMKQLIEKSRKAAASDCRKVKNKNQLEIEFRNQAVTKIQEIKMSYKNIADEYIKECKQYDKIIRLSSVLQKRLTKSYRRAVRKEAATLITDKKEDEKKAKDDEKNAKRDAQQEIRDGNKAQRETKKENKVQAQTDRDEAKAAKKEEKLQLTEAKAIQKNMAKDKKSEKEKEKQV